MHTLTKILSVTVLLASFWNSPAFSNSKWKNGNYFCNDPVAKKIIDGGNPFRTYQTINFRINKNNVKMLNGAFGVVNSTDGSIIGRGIDKGVKTQDKSASFLIDKRNFGFIVTKTNTEGNSTHLVRLLVGNQINITSKAVALPMAYIKTVKWQASCTFSKSTKTNQLETTSKSCKTTPFICNDKQLCKLATYSKNNKNVWNKVSSLKHVTYAKQKGLSCGVKDINIIKEVLNIIDNKNRIQIKKLLSNIKLYNSSIKLQMPFDK